MWCMRAQGDKRRSERRQERRRVETASLSREELGRRYDELSRELERARGQVERQQREIAERDERLAEAGEKIAEAQKTIERLERELAKRKRNSTNSSKPPSSDGLAGDPRKRGAKGKKGKRKPGGQPGHPGHRRELVEPEEVTRFVDLYPDQCGMCGELLPADGRGLLEAEDPRRHQVAEIPEIKPEIVEYRLHRVICPDRDCACVTAAVLPKEAESHMGPRLVGLIAYMTAVCRMPRRMVGRWLDEALGIPVSLGATQKAWEEASAAVEAPYQELAGDLTNQKVLNGDETGHRTNGDKRWLWVLVARMYAVYKIAKTRRAEVLVELLGRVYKGILCSDRCPSYSRYHKGRLQYCWAHFKRNLAGALELAKSTASERFYRDALALHARMFRLWHRHRGNGDRSGPPITRQQLRLKMIPIEKRFLALAERHLDSPDPDVRTLAEALYKNMDRFFLFVDHEGVEPTNNSAERALRHAVIWRKIMFGCRSEVGETAVSRLLTVTQTCKMQKRPILAYLTGALQAHRSGRPAESLLPR